jgi:hypothetical protein
MPAPTRSVAIELHENANAIEVWRATLAERRRKRLIHPLSNARAWRQSTGNKLPVEKEYSGDLRRDALKHWQRFRDCLEAMPPDEAAVLWSTLSVEITAPARPHAEQ